MVGLTCTSTLDADGSFLDNLLGGVRLHCEPLCGGGVVTYKQGCRTVAAIWGRPAKSLVAILNGERRI